MFSTNIKTGDTVYLVELVAGKDEPQLISEHVITRLLKTRMYVNNISNHFYFPGGGMPHTNWSVYLTEDKP